MVKYSVLKPISYVDKHFLNLLQKALLSLLTLFYSLEGRFDDDDLQQLLDDIQTHRSFQY